ncbi:MAG TPA: alpha/beta hydrolase [Solirubrobacteraceae bacterium]|jgi:pimeloyl-ACP methyl ester carboxylesterase
MKLLAIALPILLLTAAPASADVASVPIAFQVENVNGTSLPCRSDGKTYRVAGRVVGPRAVVEGDGRIDAATLYLHEYSFGSWFWTFDAVPGYDYATAMAERGHVSVVVDRLGYDGSDHPPGLDTCLGAHADMARQVVGQLKAGRFDHVVLAGHSVGAVAAELAVTSFGEELGVDGLVVFALANQGYTQASLQESFVQGGVCTTGGEPAEEGQPSGYAYYGQTPEAWRPLLFASAEPRVQEAATALRNRDPCGDVSTLTPATAHNAARQADIKLPVLLVFGGADAVYETGTGEKEAAAFTGSDDVSYHEVAGAGHALALEREAPQVRATVAEWLEGRGLVARERAAGGPDAGPGAPAPTGPVAGPQLPPAGRPGCVKRRGVRLRVRRRGRMVVRVDGRVVRRGRARSVRIRFGRRARRDGRVTVTAVVRTRDGGTFRIRRRYRTCASAR